MGMLWGYHEYMCVQRVTQCHCVERWYLIILLWRQWEVRHPHFSLCFEALWERCGLENIFFLLFWSSYSKHWAKSVKLGAVLQLFWEPEWGIAALCPISMDRLVLLTPVLIQVTEVLVREVWMDAGAPWQHWPEEEEHMGGFLPSLSSFPRHAKHSFIQKILVNS